MSGKWSYVASTSSGTTLADYEPIVAKQDTALQGEWVARMGATSGYNRGQVVSTYSSVSETDANGQALGIAVIGAVVVNVGAQLGDSGGPVYVDPLVYVRPGQATITGIEFGSNFPTSTMFWYSSLENIYLDLGPMTVYGTTVRISGPTLITQPGSYTWTANALGSTGYHFQWQQSNDNGSTWSDIGTDEAFYTQTWQSIGSGLRYQFLLRVTANGTAGGYGQTATSDALTILVSG